MPKPSPFPFTVAQQPEPEPPAPPALDTPPEIETAVILVTPEIAEEWVTGKTHNRDIVESNTQKFMRLLETGNFKLTHQGVALDVDGRLLDGQHRLLAIVNTGIQAYMMVSKGWPRETQQFIDQGRSRTAVDVAKLREPKANVTSYRMAVARRMLIGTRGSIITTIPDVVDFADEHADALTFSIDDAMQGKRPRYVNPAGVGSILARAYYHESRVRLVEFGQTMIGTRTPQGEADSGAHLLREWLLSGAPIYGAVRVSKDLLVYMKAQRALVAFLAHEKIKNLYPQQDEQWPLPGEQRRATRSRSIKRTAAEPREGGIG